MALCVRASSNYSSFKYLFSIRPRLVPRLVQLADVCSAFGGDLLAAAPTGAAPGGPPGGRVRDPPGPPPTAGAVGGRPLATATPCGG